MFTRTPARQFRRRRPGARVRTATRLQVEDTECGAVALGIVLEQFGTYRPAVELRTACGVSRDGSKALNLLRAARQLGLDAAAYRREPEALSQLRMPVILHWNLNHFVVLEGFEGDEAYINDPASGPRRLRPRELDLSFTGVVLTFAPREDFRPGGIPPRLLVSLLQRLRGSGSAAAFLVLAGLGLVATAVAMPVLVQVFVDELLVGGQKGWLPVLLAGLGVTAMLRAGLTWLKATYLLKLQARMAVGLSSGFLWHALRLPMQFFGARAPGDLASRMGLNERVAGLLSGRLADVLLELLLVGLYLALLLAYDRTLAGIAAGTALAYVFLLLAQDRARADDSLRIAATRSTMEGVAAGGLAMIETLKATGSESTFFARWSGYQAKLLEYQQSDERRGQWFRFGTQAFLRFNSLLVLGLGAWRVMEGELTLGGLVSVQSLMASFVAPIARLSTFGAELQGLRGSVDRIDDVLAHAPEHSSAPRLPGLRLTGELHLRDVAFGYSPLAPPLVAGVSLSVLPGQRVAVVGGSGSGKSTLARLVAGLYRPWRGQVQLDGRSLEGWSRRDLAAAVAFVDQDIALFQGTIRDNLTLWDSSVSDEELWRAAVDACIHDDIMRLPGGYQSQVVEGGANLSGGQRQRVELARALLRDPALLVLDEATSALDASTERQVELNLRRRGISSLVIAHRLSTVRDCDEIIVLDHGQVVERGTHDQLLASGGRYRQLLAAA